MAEKSASDSRKRLHEDSDANDSKRARVESSDDSNLPDSTMIHENILDILDDMDNVVEADVAVQGSLDSVIKSLEEEIMSPPHHQPDLWYLLEASDDELGLPPSFASSGDEQSAGSGNLMTLEDDYAVFGSLGFEADMEEGYGWFEFGVDGDSASEVNSRDGDFLSFGGLFDNGYVGVGSERVEISDPL